MIKFRMENLPVLSRSGVIILALCATLPFHGCGKRQPPATEAQPAMDLSERFSLTTPGSPEPPERFLKIIRKGVRKDSLVLIAPSAITAPLFGLSGRRTLRFWAAPVFNIGDGVQMNVFLRRSGIRILVGSRYFDPGRNAEDRSWIPVSIALEVNEGDLIEIEASAGPQGDLTADWLALNSVVVTP